MIVIAIIAIIAAIAIPNLLEARKAGNEAAAIGTLKVIATSQLMFRKKIGRYADLTELGSEGLVDRILGNPAAVNPFGQTVALKQGYLFGTGKGPGAFAPFAWICGGEPALKGNTGDRFFITNHRGVIFVTRTRVPNAILINPVDYEIDDTKIQVLGN